MIAVFSVCFYVLVFGTGISSTPWTVNAEIFPLHLIGTASSLGAAINWITNAVICEVFKLVSEINLTARVLLYVSLGIISIGTYFFVYCLIPETAGKPIEENLDAVVGKGYYEREQKMLEKYHERQKA